MFKDLLSSAFENDRSLSNVDIRDGQLDDKTDEELEFQQKNAQTLTSTQQQWRQTMLSGGVTAQDVANTYTLDLFLTGVPNKDPSNDLFGGKTNIISRDRDVGLTLPETPTVSNVKLQFSSEDNSVQVLEDDTGFCQTGSTTGEYKLSDDMKQIRFRIPVTGYTRTIETKGTISKVYWSKEEEKKTQTSTTYSIPEGWLYGEAELTPVSPGRTIGWNDCVLKIEQSVGLLGVSSKMVPVGKFAVQTTRVPQSEER